VIGGLLVTLAASLPVFAAEPPPVMPAADESSAASTAVPLKLDAELSPSAAAPPAGEATAGTVPTPTPPAAAPGPQRGPLLDTLPAIMAKVWAENPQVLQAQQALEATGYDITSARAGYLPYLQLQSAVSGKSSDSISTLYVVLPIWSGGATNAQVDVAKARQKAALAELARTRLDLGQRTLDAYFSVAQAQDQMIQWQNYVGALKKLLGTITRRDNQGMAPQADVETAISRLKQAQASAEANRALLLTNRAQLTSLLNVPPGAVAWPEDGALLSDSEIAATADRVELHPSHLAARAEIDVQDGTARGAKAALWPEFSLQHRRQLNGVQFDPSNDATLLVASFQSNNGVAGFFGYRAEAQRLESARSRLTAADRDVTATLEVDKAQLSANAAQLEVQSEAAQSATALVESFIRQFDAGRKSWLEVLNAQREANDILLQSINLRSNYWHANEKLALDSMNWQRLGATVVDDETGKAINK
jgi:outer membrane protein TolC